MELVHSLSGFRDRLHVGKDQPIVYNMDGLADWSALGFGEPL